MNEPLPEWIRVWQWYRRTHPKDRRPFPQEAHFVDEELADYTHIREMWLKATEEAA